MEKKIWQASIKDNLLIEYGNITESYWDAKKQELRDNGHGNIELTDEYKQRLFEEERTAQRESLEKWANYLGDEHSPYPLWFKVYAWNGMTKMGKYNKAKGRYETRNETTVAPYPDPDAEILANVFDLVNRYHGNDQKEFYTEEGERNIKLEQIVSSGNFSKIYNAVQQDILPIVEPPQKTEDVHGEWIEYGLGDEDDVARAANGTGWCIGGSTATARHYLAYGNYGQASYSGENEPEQDNGARFILFHIIDPKTGKMSKNAVASIRLDTDGQVAEISGLESGQALNDSLVPIVEEKVKSLPGGEEFLPKFADKNRLIALDRKMGKDEDLTKGELEFLYEIHGPIHTLDTYNNHDPRLSELRGVYNIEYALKKGIDIDQLISKTDSPSILSNLDVFLAHGASINDLVSRMSPNDTIQNLDALINFYGAEIDIDDLVSRLSPYEVSINLDTILSHITDIDSFTSAMNPYDVFYHLDIFLSHGAKIDIDELMSKISPYNIAKNLDDLLSRGAKIDIEALVSRLPSFGIEYCLDSLLSHGVDIDTIVSRLDPPRIIRNLDTLFSHGAKIDIDQLIAGLPLSYISSYLDTLLSHGASVDSLTAALDSLHIANNLQTLLAHGASIDSLISKMYPSGIIHNLEALLSYGANMDNLVSRLDQYTVLDNLDILISHGAKIDYDSLVFNAAPQEVCYFLDKLIVHGAKVDVNRLIFEMDPSDIADNVNVLIRNGADINNLVSRLDASNIAYCYDDLIDNGADSNTLDAILEQE